MVAPAAAAPAIGVGGGAALGAASGLIGGAFSAWGQSRSIKWQKQLARNKYQYMVNDLRKAGLNPALAYANASPGAGGASAPGINAPDIAGSISSAMQAKLLNAQVEKVRSEIRMNDAKTDSLGVPASLGGWFADKFKHGATAVQKAWDWSKGQIGDAVNSAKTLQKQGKSRRGPLRIDITKKIPR